MSTVTRNKDRIDQAYSVAFRVGYRQRHYIARSKNMTNFCGDPDQTRKERKIVQSRSHKRTVVQDLPLLMRIHRLESNLLALELAEAAAVGADVSTTAPASAAPAAPATSAAAASTTTTALGVSTARARRAEVQAHRASGQLRSLEALESVARLVDRRERDVAEALGATGLGVGRQPDTGDVANFGELLVDGILRRAEREVANEQSVALGAGLVTERPGPSLGAVLEVTLVVVGLATVGVVEVDLTAVDLGILLGLVRLGGIGGVGELDVTEAGEN